jgi:hypothetical protein
VKQRDLGDLAIDQLVARFAELGVAQDGALIYDQILKYNKLYKEMTAVELELRARGKEALLALMRLYHHSNIQVREQAAIRTLGVAPAAARKMLETIVASRCFPQAGDAASMLRALDSGEYTPG